LGRNLGRQGRQLKWSRLSPMERTPGEEVILPRPREPDGANQPGPTRPSSARSRVQTIYVQRATQHHHASRPRQPTSDRQYAGDVS
jgi:hypothetical protein